MMRNRFIRVIYFALIVAHQFASPSMSGPISG